MKLASLWLLGITCSLASAAHGQESPPTLPKGNLEPRVPAVPLPLPKPPGKSATPPLVAAPVVLPKPPVVEAAPVVSPKPPVVTPKPAVVLPKPPVVEAAPVVSPKPPVIEAAPVVSPATACPPGAFCEPGEVEAPRPVTPAEPWTVPLPPPAPGSDPSKPRVIVVRPGSQGGAQEITVYEDTDYTPPHTFSPPPMPMYGGRRFGPRHREEEPRYGVALRGEAALLPSQGYDNSIGGVGISFRYRPMPWFAVDAGLDVLSGIDTNGFARREVPLSASSILYVNPGDFSQFYLIGGLNLSFARVASNFIEPNFAGGSVDDYTYLGGQFGAGVEFRFARALAFNIDALGIVRSRIDSDGGGRYAEYYDKVNGFASNSSASGLLRAGLVIWW